MTIRVCDAPMGSGKTSAAINYMRAEPDTNFIFVTPFLSEVDRVIGACNDRRFVAPVNTGHGKLKHLELCVERGRSLVCTHKLFSMYTEKTKQAISDVGYTLILDETMGVIEKLEIGAKDFDLLIHNKVIEFSEDGKTLRCIDDSYYGRFCDEIEKIRGGRVFSHKGDLICWMYPPEMFDAFDEVIILTYMFDSQIQKYYYDISGIEVEYIGVVKNMSGEYHFVDYIPAYSHLREIPNLIHICEDDKLNEIGWKWNALSSTWYRTKYREDAKTHVVTQLGRNVRSFFRSQRKSSADENLWTTFSQYEAKFRKVKCVGEFLAFNSRATNDYRDKTNLAYCVNVFYDPPIAHYFSDYGISVDTDGYALSTMIQWIWRSAIRDGKEIWIYIPSKRMRDLLKQWLKEISK